MNNILTKQYLLLNSLATKQISLSEQDTKLFREIVDSKLKPGFPNF